MMLRHSTVSAVQSKNGAAALHPSIDALPVQVCFVLDQSSSITSTGWTSARNFVAQVITDLASQTKGHSSCASTPALPSCCIFCRADVTGQQSCVTHGLKDVPLTDCRYSAVKFDSAIQSIVGQLTSNAASAAAAVRCSSTSANTALRNDRAAPRVHHLLRLNAHRVSDRRKAKQNKLGTFLEEGIDGCATILARGDHKRQKLMVIITDGQPNKCGTTHAACNAAFATGYAACHATRIHI